MRFFSRPNSFFSALRHAPLLLAIASNTALAFPVTYEFHGYVTDYSSPGSEFNPVPGERINGTVTYDANYDGTYYGGPWPSISALLSWRISIGGDSYYQQPVFVNPFTHSVYCCNQETILFYDEMPSNSEGLPQFDQGGFSFQFSELGDIVPTTLPVERFLAGSFIFAGTNHPGAFFGGVIDELKIEVPEPSILSLFGLGLAGIVLTRRRKV